MVVAGDALAGYGSRACQLWIKVTAASALLCHSPAAVCGGAAFSRKVWVERRRGEGRRLFSGRMMDRGVEPVLLSGVGGRGVRCLEAGEQQVWCRGGSRREKCVSVLVSEDGLSGRWNRGRQKCGFQGGVREAGSVAGGAQARVWGSGSEGLGPVKEEVVKVGRLDAASLQLQPVSGALLEYFKKRGISERTVRLNGVMECRNAIAFVYRREGEIVNCKFRDVRKKFWQAKGGQKVLYGLDQVEKEAKQIVIVEGEMDKLSMDEAGVGNCVSVPDGAPAKVSEKDVSATDKKKYGYLWNCKDYLEKATKIVIATDADEPGQALAEELARRLGRSRCWRVRWPVTAGGGKLKDANEVLSQLGKDALCECVSKAEMFPIRGLFHFSDFCKEIDDYYYLRLGDESGVSTGWRGLDGLYRVVPGELTVVTGVPNSGKSEWIDALLCNLNRQKQWSFALCSMENKVREHARKLLEKYLRKPFFDAPYAQCVPRMSPQDLAFGNKWLDDHFYLIRCEDEELPSIDWVLQLAKAAVMRHGIRGLVIDPYNELDHQRHHSQTETEYVSQMLTKVKRFAQHHDCHVWFVAHPKQLAAWRGEAPGLYDIAGSAHFVNKCDNGLVIHRNRDPDAGPLDAVHILVKKVRNKAAGTIGEAFLSYDRVCGAYDDAAS